MNYIARKSSMNDRFEKAKSTIIEKVPPVYYGAFLRFNIQGVDWIRNVAYDGENYYYNKEWVDELSDEELEIVMLHDILHYVCGHPFEAKATSQNEKSVQIYMLECDKHVEKLMVKLGYNPYIKPNVSEHRIWMKAHDVVSGKRNGSPWLKHDLLYENEKVKQVELVYCYNIGDNENSSYQHIMGIKTIEAFFSYDYKGDLIRVTRRNKDVRKIIDS